MPGRKFIVRSLLFIVLLVVISLSFVSSQWSTIHSVTPLEQAQNDYSFQLSKYNTSREKYLTAQANYLSFKTAVAKNEAFIKTKEYFLQCHDVYTAYLLLVEERTNIFDWSFSSYKKDDYIRRLKSEQDFIRDSKAKAQSVQTLEEIPPLATQLETHFDKTTIPAVNNVLATADLAQIEDTFYLFRQTSHNIDDFVKAKITDSNMPLYLNWKSEIDGIKSKIDIQIERNRQTLSSTSFGDSFNASHSLIYDQTQQSRTELERAKSLLAEILDFI